MERYGNQFASRVEVNTADGYIFADVVQESTGQGWFRVVIGGVMLSPMYANKEDAQDAADVILGRLVAGESLVYPMPEEEEVDDTGTFTGGVDPDAYPVETVPTGWDSADHKALYE
jgi:hypothetical protein